MLEKDFKELVLNIKQEISQTQVLIMSDANVRLINLYFKIGKVIYENSNWGNKFIENLERELKLDFPNIKGFSARNLGRMKKFYLEYKDEAILPMALAKLPWSQNMTLIDKIKDKEKREWYRNEAINGNWSVVVLEHQIDIELYERQSPSDKSNNFENTLINPQSDLANDLQNDPYIFNLPLLKEKYVETELEKALVERIKDTLLELGKGFSFLGNQYKITDGENDYFIDMLFYHVDLNCYIVVELKSKSFKPEYTGQLAFYMSAIDKTKKKDTDNPTIGLLLCKEKNKISVEWALDKINAPIGMSNYEVTKLLPKEMIECLPTEEDINLHVDIEED